MASNIFSLGMCVLEVLVVGKYSGEDAPNGEVMNFRSQHSDELTSAQINLFEAMWLADPSKRPTISSVVCRLEQFASEENSKHQSLGRLNATLLRAKGQAYDLERFVFSELESTIRGFLEKLEWKCRYCLESQEVVCYIFKRAVDIHGLLQRQHRRPNDVVVVSYCEVLLSLNRFLMSAAEEKSVLLRTKSKKVALKSNLSHRRMDELLELLAPTKIGPIHDWRQRAARLGENTESKSTEDERVSSEDKENVSSRDQAAAGGERAPIMIVRFKRDRLNNKFKELNTKKIKTASTSAHLAPRPEWFIHSYDLKYTKHNLLGTRAFGEVYKATWCSTPVVIKFMGYEADEDASRNELFFHELRVWFPLSHPHVVKLYGACHVGKLFFVCEYVGNGTLIQYLKREGNVEKNWHLLYQVSLGLRYLHDHNILHNDLKCDNVLIGTGDDAKITDFGLSCILKSAEVEVDPKKQGVRQWKSPEYIRGDRLTLAPDGYSVGMCILEAMTVELPWGGLVDATVRRQVKKGNLPLRPSCLSDSQWNLIRMMCATDPSQRVKISHVADKLYEFSQQPKDSMSSSSDAP